MSKIAIAGGAGFIAYHLSKSLIDAVHEVCSFDSFNDYYDVELKNTRRDNLKMMGVDIAMLDLKYKAGVRSFMEYHKPDAVIHLGAYAGVRHSLKDPSLYIDNNIVGTQNLIDACEEVGVESVVYASTSCTMAGNQLPWKEDEKCGYQLNPYGYTKFTNEAQFMSSGLTNAIGLRFFTVYGPWGRPDMALFDFTKNIVEGNPITLFNNGDMVRDFTYVDDIVAGINIIVTRCLENTIPKQKDVYNIGYGDKVPLMEFVDHIEANLGRTAIKEFAPMHPADTQTTWSDTTKLQALGYKPTTPISVGVERFVTWYKGYYNVN
jgi:UDP-glucuronate 4-epimerase